MTSGACVPPSSIPTASTKNKASMSKIYACSRLQTMRGLFILVLLSAFFVAYITTTWPQPALT